MKEFHFEPPPSFLFATDTFLMLNEPFSLCNKNRLFLMYECSRALFMDIIFPACCNSNRFHFLCIQSYANFIVSFACETPDTEDIEKESEGALTIYFRNSVKTCCLCTVE